MIINPIWFYLMNVCESLGMFLLVVGIFMLIYCGIIFLLYPILEDMMGHFPIKMKKMFIIGSIFIFLSCLIPTKETCYQMLIASLVTKENIEFTIDSGKEVIDYLIEKVDELNDNQEED